MIKLSVKYGVCSSKGGFIIISERTDYSWLSAVVTSLNISLISVLDKNSEW